MSVAKRRWILFAGAMGVVVILIKGIHEILSLYQAPKSLLALSLVAGVVVEVVLFVNGIMPQLRGRGGESDSKIGQILSAVQALLPGHPPSEARIGRSRQFVLDAIRTKWLDSTDDKKQSDHPRLKIRFMVRGDGTPPGAGSHAEGNQSGGNSVLEAFTSAKQQLVVLGPPGAGKTTLVLALCRALVDRAEANQKALFPVYFQLSGWKGDEDDFADWLVSRLRAKPYSAGGAIASHWIKAEEDAIIILDGLDEVRLNHRAACVAAINAFHDEHGQVPLVVSCRTADYDALAEKLAIGATIEVRPLTVPQVDAYLEELGSTAADLRNMVKVDPQLAELLTNPLVLFVASETTQDPKRMTAGLSPDERKKHLLLDFIEQRIQKWPPPEPKDAVTRWLTYLAEYIGGGDDEIDKDRRGTGTFYLDSLQPDALPTRSQRFLLSAASAGIWFAVCAIIAVVAVLIGDLFSMVLPAVGLERLPPLRLPLGSLMNGYVRLPEDFGLAIVLALVMAALIGVPLGWSGSSEISLSRGISLAGVRKMPLHALIGGLIVAAMSTAIFGSIGAILTSWVDPDVRRSFGGAFPYAPSDIVVGVANALICAAIAGAIIRLTIRNLFGAGIGYAATYGALLGIGDWHVGTGPWLLAAFLGWLVGVLAGATVALEPEPYLEPAAPGEAMQIAKRNALIAGAAGLLVGLVVLAPGAVVIQFARTEASLANIYTAIYISAVFGLLSAVIAAKSVGGSSYVCNRLLLWSLGRQGIAPHDYLAFLEDGARTAILRRRGGGYQFLHGLIQACFFRHEVPPPSSQLVPSAAE